jgi:hypothetical protein
MKIHPFVTTVFILAMTVFAEAGSVFVDQVNAAWRAQDYDKILQLANKEVGGDHTNPEGFVVLFGYQIYVTGNRQAALESLDKLIAALQVDRPGLVQAARDFRDEFEEAPFTPGARMSPEQVAQIHSLLPNEFPVKALLIRIAAKQ